MIRMWVFVLCLCVLMLAGGCPPAERTGGPVIQCKGKGSIEAAVEALELQRINLHSIRASARCVMEWTDPDGKERKENLDAALVFVPPDLLYCKGDKLGGEIRFGTNEEAFWYMIKPEIDTYWWGMREAAEGCVDKLAFNPWNVTEALGVVQVDTSWSLDYQDGYDILTKTDAEGGLRKQIRIRACDYQIVSIETGRPDGRESVQIVMDHYTATEQGLSVPAVIEIRHRMNGKVDAVLGVTLKGIRRFEMDTRSRDRLFSRPSEDNYGTVYRLSSMCEFVEVGR